MPFIFLCMKTSLHQETGFPKVRRKIQPEKKAGTSPRQNCVHYVQACPGTSVCRFGVLDSLGLGMRLEKLLVGYELPAKTKIGVSGCPNNCGEAYVRDIGVFARKGGWVFIFGGNSGRRPRIGDVLAEGLTGDEVVALAKNASIITRQTPRARKGPPGSSNGSALKNSKKRSCRSKKRSKSRRQNPPALFSAPFYSYVVLFCLLVDLKKLILRNNPRRCTLILCQKEVASKQRSMPAPWPAVPGP